jgi:Ni/Co efflux regulator RcnB
MIRALVSLFAIVALGLAPAAWADKPVGPPGPGKHWSHGDRDRDHGHDRDDDHDHDHGGVGVHVDFSVGIREQYHDWYGHEYGRGHCPPGLAKKHNGCLPPGQAKKRYAVGRPLPAGIVIGPVPVSLSHHIGPPPPGYVYGVVDGDLVKLAVGTLLVVDAIDGLASR